MIKAAFRTTGTLAVCLIAGAANASSSAWERVEGGAVRVVTQGLPDAEGKLRGALEITLNPGWKTYWRDPGESGIPPSVTVTEPAQDGLTEIGFPAPTRFNQGYSVWAGYDQSLTLPLTFSLPDTAADQMSVSVFLGICEVICIPVQAELAIDLTDNSQALPDSQIVEAAFASLPAPASEEFGTTLRKTGRSNIVVDATVPNGADDAELFVAGTEDWAFGTPKRSGGSETVTFDIPVVMAPESGYGNNVIHYTLVAGDRAVSGTFEVGR
ncbi:MAG: hypothetical protein JJ913_13750 [Rhizobiaceae bacterium]|nr:hypothetical protein [Rhizobiaceae bacterium]